MGGLFYLIGVILLFFLLYVVEKRERVRRRKYEMTLDAIYRYCMMRCEEMESDHARQG